MTVVGIRRTMSFGDPAMRALWRGFRPRVEEVRQRASDDFVSMRIYRPALTTGPTPASTFEQWAAVEVTGVGGVPGGMDAHTLAGGTYAVFTYRGPAHRFEGMARYIFGEWLPTSGYALADREHFEVMGPAYRPDDPAAEERVFIPVRSRGGDASANGSSDGRADTPPDAEATA
jgi:AraC family transcriptional regulator